MSRVSPARRCAFTVVRRVFEQGAFADRALHAEAANLDPRERALATRITYGTVQRKRTLDHILQQLIPRSLDKLDPPVLAALEIGLFQLILLDAPTEYATVHQSVELIKESGRGGAPLVNAVLRRAVRDAPRLLKELDDSTPDRAAVLHSVPDWLAQLWFDELGAEEARRLLAVINRPAENAIRANTLITTADAVRGELEPIPTEPAPELPEGLVVRGAFDAFGSELFAAGAIMPQSRASMLVGRALDPHPGERVLDLCAAPGAKTTHLSALMGAEGEIVAVEVHPGRAQALEATCRRTRASNVTVANIDGRALTGRDAFDRVLVDPPCSGLGTLQSRPDLRWQPNRADTAGLAAKQTELLDAAADAVKPGGTVVYSVCTISHAEGDRVIDDLLARRPQFTCEERRQLLPDRDGTDGFFIARLQRR